MDMFTSMSTWSKVVTIALLLGLIGAGIAFTLPTQYPHLAYAQDDKECAVDLDPTILRNREEQLLKAGRDVLNALRAQDTEKFLSLINRKHFGTEGRSYTLTELRKLFKDEEVIYCYLFDSECIPPLQMTTQARAIALSDLAKRPGAKVRNVEVWKHIGDRTGCGGHVQLLWPNIPGELLTTPVTRFAFVYENGRWITVGFDEPAIAELEKPGPDH